MRRNLASSSAAACSIISSRISLHVGARGSEGLLLSFVKHIGAVTHCISIGTLHGSLLGLRLQWISRISQDRDEA
ncbi:hypothetical protein SCHPADRAFT_593007 [Schizopora paradoxa]|uniref:Uncharacterized protein n=1 Tax=Schizopora paradoxa TaxID=27342 RepID=A0A0H2RAJ3_9AGAM|nr:hypothetical protein SCHPADRAFT_593007 [Schizopora paradoxa]